MRCVFATTDRGHNGSLLSRINPRAVSAAAGLAIGLFGTFGTAAAQADPLVLRDDAGESRVEPALTPADVLTRASTLLADDQPVRASHLLRGLAGSDLAVSMTTAEQTRFFSLLRSAERAVAAADPVSVSLERAEIAFIEGDLREAGRQAGAVVDHDAATDAQRSAAEALLMMVRTRQAAEAKAAAANLDAAEAAFAQGRYVKAGRLLSRVTRAGAPLAADASDRLASLQNRLLDMDPSLLDTGDPLSLALLDPPGTDWLVGQPGDHTVAPALAAAEQANNPDGPAALNADAGEPSEVGVRVSAVQPEQADQPEPPAGGGDIVENAVRAEAQRLLTEADAAFEARRLSEAASKYEQLLEPFYARLLDEARFATVRDRLAEARVALQVGPGPEGDILGREIDERERARQRLRAEFENFARLATESIRQGDIDTARQQASQAQLALLRGQNLLSAAEAATYEAEVSELFASIESQEERLRQQRAEAQSEELARAQRQARERAAAERDRRIQEHIERIYDLQLEQDYEAALQEVEQLLFLDRNNTAGKLLFNALRDTIILRGYQQARQEINRGVAREAAANIAALVPPPDVINYPDDWIEISQRRTGAQEYVETAVNRAVLATLENQRTRADFQDAELEDVLRFIAQIADLQYDVDWDSLDEIGVDRDDAVTLQLTNIPLDVLLNRTLERVSEPETPAGWAVRDGVLTIASDEVLRRNRVLQIYDIRDLLFEIPDAEDPPDFDLNSIFSQGGEGGGGGGQSPFQGQAQDREQFDREERIEEIIEIIRRNIDTLGWEANGGRTGAVESFNDSVLIVTNTPRNHRAITGLLRQLRQVRSLQINVEARFLTVSEDFFEQIGFDLDLYFGGNSNEFQNAQLLDPTLALSDFFGAGGTELLENVNGGGGFDLDGSGTIDPTETTAQPRFEPGTQGDDFSPVSGAQSSFDIVEALNESAFASSVLGVGPALGVAGRFLDDVQVDFILQATQADRRSVQLTAPRLTFTNGTRSYIAVGTQFSFVSDAQPVASASAVAFDPTISVVSEGAVLDVIGVVSADRRYVTLTVDIALGDVSFEGADGTPLAVDVAGVAGGVGDVEGGIATATIQIPTVVGSELFTTVTVPDQGTILLGGQRLVNEFSTESGVPVLSKLPIINRFFSNRLDATEEQTLLVLIKPTILIQNEEEERNFPGLLDSIGQ